MSDETAEVLREIASLLRRRVEQHEKLAQQAEERMATTQLQASVKDLSKWSEDSNQRFAKLAETMGKTQEQEAKKKALLQEQEVQFKNRLLAELERHNGLLERLLSKLG